MPQDWRCPALRTLLRAWPRRSCRELRCTPALPRRPPACGPASARQRCRGPAAPQPDACAAPRARRAAVAAAGGGLRGAAGHGPGLRGRGRVLGAVRRRRGARLPPRHRGRPPRPAAPRAFACRRPVQGELRSALLLVAGLRAGLRTVAMFSARRGRGCAPTPACGTEDCALRVSVQAICWRFRRGQHSPPACGTCRAGHVAACMVPHPESSIVFLSELQDDFFHRERDLHVRR